LQSSVFQELAKVKRTQSGKSIMSGFRIYRFTTSFFSFLFPSRYCQNSLRALPELLGKKIAIKLHNGETIAGKLLETSRFWIKLEDTNGNVIQIHKAFMAVIYPLTR